jgi:hypothetical protein
MHLLPTCVFNTVILHRHHFRNRITSIAGDVAASANTQVVPFSIRESDISIQRDNEASWSDVHCFQAPFEIDDEQIVKRMRRKRDRELNKYQRSKLQR